MANDRKTALISLVEFYGGKVDGEVVTMSADKLLELVDLLGRAAIQRWAAELAKSNG